MELKKQLLEIREKYPETRTCPKKLWLAFYCIHSDLKENLTDYEKFKAWLLKPEIVTPGQLLMALKINDDTIETKKYIDELRTKYTKEDNREFWWTKD